jgi:proteasome alpha subunit
MTEEPYRWLEAVRNRREYIRDQLKGGTPVFAISRPEGILLLGVGQGQSKVFEIYDRQAMAALGHPADLERLRQEAIQAAHVEGFERSPQDVTLRRLIAFSLSARLKAAFEQIFTPPLIVESIFAELGERQEDDLLARVRFDGSFSYETGVAVAHTAQLDEKESIRWLREQLLAEMPISRVAELALAAWKELSGDKPFSAPHLDGPPVRPDPGRVVEAALLDRNAAGRVRYCPLDLELLAAAEATQ